MALIASLSLRLRGGASRKIKKNEAADKLAALGAQIPDGHRIVERNSREPQMLDAEHKDNG